MEMPITKKGPMTANGEEEMQVLKRNSAAEGEKAAKDAEKGTEEKSENGRRPMEGQKGTKRSERQLLLGPEEIERYRKDPLWKALRFALFGSLVCLFLLLVVVAVLIVVLSSKCVGGEEIGSTAKTIELLKSEERTDNEWTKFAGNAKDPLPLISVREGESASFQCANSGEKIRWHRKRQKMAEEIVEQGNDIDGIQLFDNGTLHIRSAKLGHAGEYICEGMAPFGKEWHRLERVKLAVENGQTLHGGGQQVPLVPFSSSLPASSSLGSVAPRVDSHLKLAFAGETVHLRCWMDGKSSDDLSWQKMTPATQQHETGSAGEGVNLLATEPDGQSAFLIFSTVKESDAGEYKCVEGHSGTSSATVRLRVEPSRTPVIEPREQWVHEHSPAQIRCSVPGHPNAQLIWRRENGVEVGTIKGVADDGKGTLRVAQVRREHARMGWVCWAVYSQRADKQALSAGPVVIRVIGAEGESEEKEETTDGQRDEEGSGQEGEDEEQRREGKEEGRVRMEGEKEEKSKGSETEQSDEIEQGDEKAVGEREGEDAETRERSETGNDEGEREVSRDNGADGGQ